MPGWSLMRYDVPQPGQLTVSTSGEAVLEAESLGGAVRLGDAGTADERGETERRTSRQRHGRVLADRGVSVRT